MRIPRLRSKILLESNPLKSRILVRRLAVPAARSSIGLGPERQRVSRWKLGARPICAAIRVVGIPGSRNLRASLARRHFTPRNRNTLGSNVHISRFETSHHVNRCILTSKGREQRIGRGDDTTGNPHRAQVSEFELFELIMLLTLDKQFSLSLSSNPSRQYLSQQ